MKRSLVGVGLTTALLLSLYACSGRATDGDGAVPSPLESGLGDDVAVPEADAPVEAAAADAAREAAVDAAIQDADADADAALAAPAVRFIGRFDTSSALGPKVGFPGARIMARFSGTEVKATFADQIVFNDYGPSRWEVIVDGASTTILSISRAQATYTLATGLPAGAHTVELVKLTEASVGISQFLGFDFSGGTLLAPPTAKARHLEFLGDSASNGYGVDGAGPVCPGAFPAGSTFSGATENANKAYPALVAHDLDADHHNLSVSGKGLYQNNYRPDPEVYSVVYPRILPNANGSTWSFADYTPDVVWMTLGGNDFDDPDGNDANAPDLPPPGAFQQKYDDMVALIRAKHPGAHVFCVVAPSLEDGFPTGYNAYSNVKNAAMAVVNKYKGLGDTKIYFYEFARSTNADLTGCDGHPNVAKHRSLADEAIAQIKAKTKWP